MKDDDLQDIDFNAIGLDHDEGGEDHFGAKDVFSAPEKPSSSPLNSNADISPIHQGIKAGVRYYFYPTWRSQMVNIVAFFALCGLAIVGSHYIPALVIAGSLFKIGGTTYYLYLPLLILLPAMMLSKVLINVYDAKYIIDDAGVEAQVGLVSLNLRQPRLRWEDIRGVEPNQSIWERLLGIGTVLVGGAATDDVEILMRGVANPRAIQLLIGEERAERLRQLQTAGLHLKKAVVMSD